MEVEPVVAILLTYERTEYALRTIAAARRQLRYPDLRWYIADDGSRPEHLAAVQEALQGEQIAGWHTLPGGTYGANANRAWDAAAAVSRLTFWLEDDWELRQPFDLRPYADLLMDDERFGMVRLGYLNLGMAGLTIGHAGRLYWWLNRESPEAYVFTGHPALRHQRFRDAYGPYTEGLRPGETELSYAWQYRTLPGPGIVWPAGLGENGVFGHIGERQSY